MGWIIVGDTDKYVGCLMYTIVGDKNYAEKVLDRILNDPDDEDKKMLKTHHNVRIEETEPKDEWWNDPFLAN